MGSHRFLAVADTLADHDRANQAGDAGVDVHDRTTGEVEGALLDEPACAGIDFVELGLSRSLGSVVGRGGKCLRGGGDVIRSSRCPYPMRDREVDEGHPQEDEHHHGRELHALGEGTDDQRGRDHCEGHLEHHVGEFRDDDAVREGRDIRIRANALQEDLAEPADVGGEAAARVTERDRIAVDNPHDADQRNDGHYLGQDREHVLGANETAVEQRQAGNRHHQDEC